jgi:hydrogenase maturation protease
MTAVRHPDARRGMRSGTGAPARAVEILVCGSADRADDGAPIAACGLVRPYLPSDVVLRIVGQLDIDDLLSIGPGAGVVVVDAATGLAPGVVVELPLTGLNEATTLVRPRSSHALAIPEVVGLAEMIRGRPLRGRVVAIGGTHFGLGRPLSRTVEAALPTFAQTILEAVEHVRLVAEPPRRGA